MKISVNNLPGLFRFTINGQDVSREIEGFTIQGLPKDRTLVELLVHNTSLDLEVDGEVILAQSTGDIANYIRTLDPDIVQARAMRNLGGMDGGTDNLIQAVLMAIADDLEAGDEDQSGADLEDPDITGGVGINGSDGLVDPLGGGF